MENIFKKFNEDFFKSSNLKIQWFDKEGVIGFTDFIIRLTIDDFGVRDNYNGYMVEVVHKTNGSICKKFFRFSDHLEMIHRENTQEYFHVWYYNKDEFEWYISKPKDTKPMIDVIERWYLTIIS